MNLNTENANGVSIVRVGESRLMYPLLSEFSTVVTQLIASGEKMPTISSHFSAYWSKVRYITRAVEALSCCSGLTRQS